MRLTTSIGKKFEAGNEYRGSYLNTNYHIIMYTCAHVYIFKKYKYLQYLIIDFFPMVFSFNIQINIIINFDYIKYHDKDI